MFFFEGSDDRPMLRNEIRRRSWLAVIVTMLLLTTGGFAEERNKGISGQPLQPRSGPRGATMFAELPAEQTGIVTSNPYDDPRMWAERYHELGAGAIGTGVAVGDYDNDGRPDIFVVSKTGTCRLFHNRGDWKFEDVTERAGVGDASKEWKQGATFADVNNDGWLDIYVCRFDAPNLLFINQRDGTFKEEAAARGLAVVDGCGQAAFADYDRDGWLDVYIQTNLLNSATHPNGRRDYLFHNNGDGTFTDVTDRAGIAGETQGHSVTWWDQNNDGWPDIYVANDFAVPDFFYRNNRDGTFAKVTGLVFPHTPGTAMGADLGDVNNDGLIDFFVADMAATTHEKDQRGLAETRGMAKEFDSTDATVAPQVARNALYLNTGMDRCLEAAYLTGLAATDWTWSVRFEDLDNDGRIDLHVTNGMNREQINADLMFNMMKAESAGERVRLMKAGPVMSESHLAFRNLGNLRFEDVSAKWGLDQKGVGFGAAFGDFDGDGDLDLIYTNFEQGVTVLRNDSDQGHRVVFALHGTISNRFGVGATIKIFTAAGVQIRQLSLARGYLSSSEPILHFGLGEENRINRVMVSWPSGRTQEFDDLAVDTKYVITEPKDREDSPAAAKMAQAGQYDDVSESMGLALSSREERLEGTVDQPLMPMRFNRRGPGVAVGDLDGDGEDEIVLGATTQDPVRVLHRTGSRYEVLPIPAIATAPRINAGPPLVFAVKGEGRNDLLLTAGGAALPAEEPEYEPQLLLNDGKGALRAAPNALPSLPISVGAVASADFDHDGRLDVFIGGRVTPGFFPEAPVSALLINRGGKFEDVTDKIAPGLRHVGMVTSALWTDVDGDGWVDLLLALDWGGIHYFHNNQGRGFEDQSTAAGFAMAGTGMWSAIAAADFNGDGHPDYVVGNLGLNTPFRATADHPTELFSGDFAGNGNPLVIDAYFEGDHLFPWRSRRELGAKLPGILRRFPKNDLYARATLEEIVGRERLAAAKRETVTELQSGVFLSQPDGSYRFTPLPRIAQIAPLQGVVAGDFDGDGKADIYAVQNSYEPVAALGRFDGGLGQLLRGDGAGNFTPVPFTESHLIVPGDAKSLVVVDLDGDGWPDFFATRNNGTSLAFRNRTLSGRQMLRVKLHGFAGNPTAVGARVQLELGDGSLQTEEIYAGGGFGSQSTAACFFGYLENNRPIRVRVRWPTGKNSAQDFVQGTATMDITEPGS